VNRSETWGGRILIAGAAIGVFVCIDLENAGCRNANAFELQFENKTKTGTESDKISFNGKADASGWLSVKVDGRMFDLDPGAYGQPAQVGRTALTDTRVTLGVWDDWVRWTSREAFSNYVTPGAAFGNLTRTGVGFNDAATSQRIESAIWKTDAMRLSLFAEYARVGEYFEAPNFIIKREDPFSIPNSTTTRLGGVVQQGPITFTLEQRTQQSLAQDNAPIKVENQVAVSLSLHELWGRSGWIPEGISWVIPSSIDLSVGQGRMRASLDQGVNGDTTSDVSTGLSWNLGKFYAYFGYWQSDYQSQLYPWKGSGIDGSLGFYEGQWAIDFYFDVSRSVTSSALAGYALAGMQPLVGTQPLMQQWTTQRYDVISGGLSVSTHF
jgi:hypothetical protein